MISILLLLLVGVLGIGTVLWLILRGQSRDDDQEIEEHYNCHICDDRDCECHRVEDAKDTSQNSSDES